MSAPDPRGPRGTLTDCTGTGETAVERRGQHICPHCLRGPIAIGLTPGRFIEGTVVPPHAPSPAAPAGPAAL